MTCASVCAQIVCMQGVISDLPTTAYQADDPGCPGMIPPALDLFAISAAAWACTEFHFTNLGAVWL